MLAEAWLSDGNFPGVLHTWVNVHRRWAADFTQCWGVPRRVQQNKCAMEVWILAREELEKWHCHGESLNNYAAVVRL